MTKPTLILDLDGTLIRNDLTFELFVLCARSNPFLFVYAVLRALTDRAAAKRMLAARFHAQIDARHLPYQPETLDLIETAKANGQAIEIVSGSDEELVRAVAEHLGIQVFKGSVPGTNLTAARKAKFLTDRHGSDFIYAGNSRADFAVWRVGQGGYAVNAPAGSFRLKRADGSKVDVEKLAAQRGELIPLLQSMRLHQWAKNLLLFIVPAIQIVNLTQPDFVRLFWGFLCFSLLASATYVLNDLFDIQDDRQHRSKAKRALASGRLSIPTATWFVALAIPAALYLSFLVDQSFGWVALAYFAVTAIYSFRLKRIAVADVFTLAGLFSIRVIAGAYIVDFPPSGWLLTFIGSFFLSLAIGKRFVEIRALTDNQSVAGRGYLASDAVPLLAAGCAIGTIAVLAMLIYGLSAPITVFSSETVVLIGSALLLSWVLRFWLLAGRGEVTDDPVVYAFKDRTSFVILATISLVFAYDLTGPLWQNLF
ncbi:MAG: UbiA family prenyltransferase [Pseudomonadota bacterium]